MNDLFNGKLPLQASPKLAQKLTKQLTKRPTRLESILPHFTPTTVPVWSVENQRQALQNYLRYLHSMAYKANWRGMHQVLNALDEVIRHEARLTQAVQADVTQLNRNGTSPLQVPAAKEALASAIRSARTELGKLMPYFWQEPRKATLAEPLFMLLLAGPQTLGFLVHKLGLYAELGQKYPVFWGPNPFSPRWVEGLGIKDRAAFWRDVAPLTEQQRKTQFRSPFKRAQQPAVQKPGPRALKAASSLRKPPLTR